MKFNDEALDEAFRKLMADAIAQQLHVLKLESYLAGSIALNALLLAGLAFVVWGGR